MIYNYIILFLSHHHLFSSATNVCYFDTIYHQSDSFAKDDLGDLGPAFGQVLCFATHPAPVWGVVATVHPIGLWRVYQNPSYLLYIADEILRIYIGIVLVISNK